jgi:hypothetical protein
VRGYLGEDLHGEERGRELPVLRIANSSNFLERNEKKRKKKARTNRFRWQDVNLVDALPCPKGANESSTFRVYVPPFSLQLDRAGCQNV